ncbi:MAG: 6-hydroxymethylpterin diphosphokinase MptE-like protein [Spirochaetia bacterium]
MNAFLQRNLKCLPPELRTWIQQAATGPEAAGFCSVESRSGHVVTGAVVAGRNRFFHSTYDPLREADRLSAGVDTETAIVLGFGTGYHLAPLLRRVARLIVVEPDLHSIVHALRRVDLTEALSHSCLRMVVGEATADLVGSVAELYLPAVHGSASVVALPGRIQADPDRFAAIQKDLRVGLELVANDFAVQAQFGRLWLRNTIANLAALTSATRTSGRDLSGSRVYPDLHGHPVVVTAAGPSLNDALGSLSVTSDVVLLATDTSLPTLTEAGITPDAVVTVDCQTVSYLHYLTAGFPQTLLLADLAAPPSVFSAHRRVGPLVSRHPLHRLLRTLGADLQGFDSSGGNVTHAAVSLAVSLGAASITVVGADFSYPNGESYARGSYVHNLFAVQASRTRPWSDALYHFARDRPGAYQDEKSPSTLRLPTLDRYREALERLADDVSIPVAIRSGTDAQVRLRSPTGPRHPGGAPPSGGSARSSAYLPPDILNRLLSLFLSVGDLNVALFDLPDDANSHAVATALLPFVAWYRRVGPARNANDLLQAAHREAIDLLSHFAHAYDAPVGGR